MGDDKEASLKKLDGAFWTAASCRPASSGLVAFHRLWPVHCAQVGWGQTLPTAAQSQAVPTDSKSYRRWSGATAKRCHSPGTPFRLWIPRSSNLMHRSSYWKPCYTGKAGRESRAPRFSPQPAHTRSPKTSLIRL